MTSQIFIWAFLKYFDVLWCMVYWIVMVVQGFFCQQATNYSYFHVFTPTQGHSGCNYGHDTAVWEFERQQPKDSSG